MKTVYDLVIDNGADYTATLGTNTCRFCKKYGNDLLKYGTRHYAHADCLFEHFNAPLDHLHDWQIRSVPYRLLKQHKLLDHPRVLAVTEQLTREFGR